MGKLCQSNNIKESINKSSRDEPYNSYARKWGYNEPQTRKSNSIDTVKTTKLNNKKLNNIFINELKFYSNYRIANDHIKYNQPVDTFVLDMSKKACVIYAYLPT